MSDKIEVDYDYDAPFYSGRQMSRVCVWDPEAKWEPIEEIAMSKWFDKGFLFRTLVVVLIMLVVLLGWSVWSMIVPPKTYEAGHAMEVDAKYESLSIDTIDDSVEFTMQGYVTILSYQEGGGGEWDNYDTFVEVLSSSGVPLFDIVDYSYRLDSDGGIGEITININAHGNDVKVIMEGKEQP